MVCADLKYGNCLVTSGIFLVPKQTAVWSVSIQPILFLSELECKQRHTLVLQVAHAIISLHYQGVITQFPYKESKL